jgi:hypothetical protein
LQDELLALLENVPLPNTTTNVLAAWRIVASFQSGCKAVSELQIPKSMDWSWLFTELTTTVTGSEPIVFQLEFCIHSSLYHVCYKCHSFLLRWLNRSNINAWRL